MIKVEYAASARAKCKKCKESLALNALRIAKVIQSPFFDGLQPLWHHVPCWASIRGRWNVTSSSQIVGFDSIRPEDQTKIQTILGETGAASAASSSSSAPMQVDSKASSTSKKRSKSKKKKSDSSDEDTSSNEDSEDEAPVARKKAASKRSKKEEPAAAAAASAAPALAVELTPLQQQSKDIWNLRDRMAQAGFGSHSCKLLLGANNQITSGGENAVLDRTVDMMLFGPLPPCPLCQEKLSWTSTGAYKCTGQGEWGQCTFSRPDVERLTTLVKTDGSDFLDSFEFKPRKRISQFSAAVAAPSSSQSSSAAPAVTAPLQDLVVCFAGRLSRNQNELKDLVSQHGGKFASSVTGNTSLLVATESEWDKMTAKVSAAMAAGIPIAKPDLFEGCIAQNSFILDAIAADSAWANADADIVKRHKASKDIAASSGSSSAPASASSDPSSSSQLVIPKPALSRRMNRREEELLAEKKVEVKIKGHSVLDPDLSEEYSEVYHVLEEPISASNTNPDAEGQLFDPKDKRPGARICAWTATLNKVDIAAGQNSYYVLQLLEVDQGNKTGVYSYVLFRKWGRIGQKFMDRNSKYEDFAMKSDAKEAFENLYFEKAGTYWNDRLKREKVAGKFFAVDVVHDEHPKSDEEEGGDEGAGKGKGKKEETPSALHPRVQSLMKMLFDVNTFKQTLKSMSIDLKKLPLGNLSKRTIAEGYRALKELDEILQAPSASASASSSSSFEAVAGAMTETEKMQKHARLVAQSNKFYMLIPHDFGKNSPPVIDTNELLKEKIELLDALSDMEVAASIMEADEQVSGSSAPAEDINLLDKHYAKLKCKIEPMDHSDPMFKLIQEYVTNTHGSTHAFDLEVADVFCVQREGEAERFKTFKKKLSDNTQLLWHGSRLTNWAGIISQGLRIAPPEAPVTGYMFGKGLYYANSCSKSSQYCMASRDNPTGIMLLSEVALGRMFELEASQYMEAAPSRYFSTKGCGRSCPDPAGYKKLEDGVIVPMGKMVPSTEHKNSTLMYDEMIVYDVAQACMKYVIRMNFKYKDRR